MGALKIIGRLAAAAFIIAALAAIFFAAVL